MTTETAASFESVPSSIEVHSPYYQGALELLRSEFKDTYDASSLAKNSESGKQILDNIDRQGIENFTVFESKKFPGVKIPITKISLENTVSECMPTVKQEIEPIEDQAKTVYVISSGFAYPPAGHPFTPWDIAYDRAIGLIPEAISAKQNGAKMPDVYVIGSPNSLWGEVTQQWIEELEVNGFAAYGALCAELLEPKLRKEVIDSQMPRTILHGMSLGSAVMRETKKHLSDDLQSRTQLLLDNPVLSHNKLQVPVGFLAESILRMALDPRLKKSMSHEAEFYAQSEKALRARGILPINDKRSTQLKQKAAIADVKNLMDITELAEDEKTFIRLGLYDPVSFSIKKFPQRLKSYKNYITRGLTAPKKGIYPINTTHLINRYRVKKWGRIINQINFPQTTG